jgi:hypothetical protein
VDTPAFVSGGVAKETFDPKLLDGVGALGMKVKVLSSKDVQPGYWAGVLVDQEHHSLRAGVSRGLEGQVTGY